MNLAAIITMGLTQLTVTYFTVYFFYKAWKTPPKNEPDSYADNDDVKIRQKS